MSLAGKLNNDLLTTASDGGLPINRLESFTQYLSKAVDCSIFMEDASVDEIMEIINGFENGLIN